MTATEISDQKKKSSEYLLQLNLFTKKFTTFTWNIVIHKNYARLKIQIQIY